METSFAPRRELRHQVLPARPRAMPPVRPPQQELQAAPQQEAPPKEQHGALAEPRIAGELPESAVRPKPCDKRDAVWQAAAQRKHYHRRYHNQSLGVASVDLSGPHEATPQPGQKVGSSPAHYFLVLTVKFPKGPVGEGAAEPGKAQPADPADRGHHDDVKALFTWPYWSRRARPRPRSKTF